MAAVLYKTDLWKVEMNDVRIFSFSNMLDKFLGIDSNAPTIIIIIIIIEVFSGVKSKGSQYYSDEYSCY